MKLHRYLALAAGLLLATAANAEIKQFVPTGPSLIEGAHLNQMVDQLNGTNPYPNSLIGTGVNKVSLSGGATTVDPVITVGGSSSDTNVGITMATKGTGAYNFSTNTNVQQFGITNTASAVDYLSCSGAATANPALVTCTATGSDTNINIVLATKAAGNVKLGTNTVSTCSGTTTATCQGQRFVVSITGLTTAASTLSAAMTVTNANVVSSASTVMCQVNGYGGTGVPVAVNVTPGTGSVALNIQNVSTGAALNATVPVACVVFGT